MVSCRYLSSKDVAKSVCDGDQTLAWQSLLVHATAKGPHQLLDAVLPTESKHELSAGRQTW